MSESQLAANTIQPSAKKPEGFLKPTNVNEALQIAEWLSKSSMVPDEYKGKPENILVAMEMGFEVGLGAMQSLQNISVIGSRPSIWGDAMLALVLGSGLCDDIKETFDDNTNTAHCMVQRKGMPDPHHSKYSFDDAKLAGLIGGKSYVWKSNPKRMCQMRARGFALRDTFPDVLKGLAKLPLTDERNVRDITPAPDPVKFDKTTGEIEETEDTEPSLPPPDKELMKEMGVVMTDINNAVSKQQMAQLQVDIANIPVDYQPPLIEAWNARLCMLKAGVRTTSASNLKKPVNVEADLVQDEMVD